MARTALSLAQAAGRMVNPRRATKLPTTSATHRFFKVPASCFSRQRPKHSRAATALLVSPPPLIAAAPNSSVQAVPVYAILLGPSSAAFLCQARAAPPCFVLCGSRVEQRRRPNLLRDWSWQPCVPQHSARLFQLPFALPRLLPKLLLILFLSRLGSYPLSASHPSRQQLHRRGDESLVHSRVRPRTHARLCASSHERSK
eukprot:1576718-Pleurochrysis_carterae.AAC.3